MSNSTDASGNSNTLAAMKPLGMTWVGYYTLDMQSRPADPLLGWTVGTGRKDMHVDLLIAAGRSANAAYDDASSVPAPLHAPCVRGCHNAFNFHPSTGLLYVRVLSRDISASLSVDAHDVRFGETFTLNQPCMTIIIGQLNSSWSTRTRRAASAICSSARSA